MVLVGGGEISHCGINVGAGFSGFFDDFEGFDILGELESFLIVGEGLWVVFLFEINGTTKINVELGSGFRSRIGR